MGLLVRRIAPRGAIATAIVLLLAATSFWAGSARAEDAPAWRITSTAEPTTLGVPRDEINEVTVKATGGFFYLYTERYFVYAPYNMSAPEMQAAFESELGPGTVEVTGGPGDATGSKPYFIKFKGTAAAEQLGMNIYPVFEGGEETATAKLIQSGANGGDVVLTAVNVGGATDGSTVTLTDTLPPQLQAGQVRGFEKYGVRFGAGQPLTCNEEAPRFTCTFPGVMEPGDSLSLHIKATFPGEVPASVVNSGTVVGGGARHAASITGSLAVGAPASFGVTPGSLVMASSSRQAGAHPNVTTSFRIATTSKAHVSGNLKDVHADLPPGLVGNTVGMPKCPAARALVANCPRDTIVGVASTEIVSFNPTESPTWTDNSPIFDIEPSPGEPAAFMFTTVFLPVRLDTSVLSDGDYAVRVTAGDLSEASPVFGSSVTIWGVPADHEGPGPIQLGGTETKAELAEGVGGPLVGASRVPLLTNPTQCSSSLTGHLTVDEWGAPGAFSGESASFGTLSGCDALAFSGNVSMLPDTLEAGAPAGYDFRLHVPQANDPSRPSQPYAKRVVTTLPMGTVVSPSAAVGLKSCSDEEFYGPPGERGLEQPAKPGACPRDSQVGTVEIRTPALALPLTGDVYLATPPCGICSPVDAQDGKMVRLFVQVVGEGESGIVVKLEGHVSLNQQTGQLTATFDNNPQLPFSDLRLTLAGGSRATLANSRICGPVSTSLDMTPWSSPFTSDLLATSTFEVNQGCIAPQFNPSFVAGTTNIQAGEYTPFTLSFGRTDRDEFLNGLQMQMPPGLLGSLKNVPLCKEPQAAQGACSEESLIGHTQVLTGPGQTPFLVTGGKVFLTEGYKGAPFGLSIVVPAKAGPFTLAGTTGTGTVVVRAAINIDPHSVALTVTSDPLPTALDGIPLQLKVVNVTIDRPGFTFNPTNCNKTAITGTLSSKESGGAHVASPFQVTNCAGLGFKPKFKVSTAGKTSRVNGASLDAKLTYPTGAKYANIAKVKVKLPRQLPSRLTTLQKACTAATFDANPGLCPKDSVVGIARAHTPILPVELTGPAYFVSHGGEAFPNLIVVLQGYGVRVDLVGDTFISKKGITSSTFNQVPDVPIESFELYLPQGKGSALAANGNLCTSKLRMPTVFTAQNGATIHQSTPIAVSGCNKKAKRARAERRGKHKRSRHSRETHSTNAGIRRGK